MHAQEERDGFLLNLVFGKFMRPDQNLPVAEEYILQNFHVSPMNILGRRKFY